MRDVGILVWVGLLIVGVVGSMISSLRRQSQRAPMPARLPEWARQIGAPAQQPVPAPAAAAPILPPRVTAAARKAPDAREPVHAAPEVRRPGARLFKGRRDVVRAVIAAEVLGKPRAFSDEYFGH